MILTKFRKNISLILILSSAMLFFVTSCKKEKPKAIEDRKFVTPSAEVVKISSASREAKISMKTSSIGTYPKLGAKWRFPGGQWNRTPMEFNFINGEYSLVFTVSAQTAFFDGLDSSKIESALYVKTSESISAPWIPLNTFMPDLLLDWPASSQVDTLDVRIIDQTLNPDGARVCWYLDNPTTQTVSIPVSATDGTRTENKTLFVRAGERIFSHCLVFSDFPSQKKVTINYTVNGNVYTSSFTTTQAVYSNISMTAPDGSDSVTVGTNQDNIDIVDIHVTSTGITQVNKAVLNFEVSDTTQLWDLLLKVEDKLVRNQGNWTINGNTLSVTVDPDLLISKGSSTLSLQVYSQMVSTAHDVLVSLYLEDTHGGKIEPKEKVRIRFR